MLRVVGFIFWILVGLVLGDEECRKNVDLIDEKINTIKDSPIDSKQIKIDVRLQRTFLESSSNLLLMEGFFIEKFQDSRLDYSDQNPCSDYGVAEYSKISNQHSPNLTLKNGIVFGKNGEISPTIIYTNGTVVEAKRLEVKIPCIPTDQFSQYGNLTCRLIWHSKKSINQEEKFVDWDEKLASMNLFEKNTGNLVVVGIEYDHNNIRFPDGDYEELIMDIQLSQSSNRLLLLFYLPSVLMVMISWFSMVLGPMAITRAILIIGSLIMLCVHYSTFNIPISNHITAIDVWKIVTIFFVFLALLELVIVSCLASTGRSRRFWPCCRPKKQKGVNYYSFEPIYEELNDLRNRGTRHTCACCRYTALFLDLFSVITFAFVFLVFMFVYVYHNQEMAHYFDNLKLNEINSHA